MFQMIVDRDTHPNRNILYIGAKVLKAIQSHRFGVIPMLDLFEKTLEMDEFSMSFDDFMLSLDWLFLLGTIEHNEEGDVVKCF